MNTLTTTINTKSYPLAHLKTTMVLKKTLPGLFLFLLFLPLLYLLSVLASSFFPTGAPTGVASLLGKRSMSFAGIDVSDDPNNNNNSNVNGDEDLSEDDGSQPGGEKKRRLNMEQVKTLERNFELGNKLEPERKMQLARALGLQPRQIAIWFQNRRARWKTKQLEKDYDLLKRQFDGVKADNEALQAQNQKLQAEVCMKILLQKLKY